MGDVVDIRCVGTVWQIVAKGEADMAYTAIRLSPTPEFRLGGPMRAVFTEDEIAHSSWRPPNAEWWKTAPNGLLVRIKGTETLKGILEERIPTSSNFWRRIYMPDGFHVVGEINQLELDTSEDE